MPPPPTTNMPERVGRYELLLPIASGGMATVYLARSFGVGGFERDVALKLTHAHLRENPHFTQDLIEEAKLAVRIKHPNVVSVLDVDDDPLGVFLVMDYIEGDSLSGLMRRAAVDGRLSARIGLRILIDALKGLHAAHELRSAGGELLNVVHRDFSPHNVLVGLDGDSRLTDFGIARAATRLSETATGLIKGKLGYMAPEQARGQKLDRRCDVWAAGVIAWEILVGRRLFKPGNDVQTLLRLVNEVPPRPSSVVRGVSAALDAVVASALDPHLASRYPDAATFAHALKDASVGAGEIAETAEVGEVVSRLVGPKLRARREHANEVRHFRARVGELVHASDPTGGTPESGILGSLPAVSQRPAIARPEALTESAPPATLAGSVPSRTDELPATDSTSVSQARERFRRRAGPRRAVVGLALTVMTAMAATLYLLFARPLAPPVAGPSAATASAPSASPVTAPSAPASAETLPSAPSSAETPPSSAAVAAPGTIVIQADAPIARITVDAQPVAIVPPREVVKVDVSAHAPGEKIELVATASDGRSQKTTIAPGVATVALVFPASEPARAARPRAKPATSPVIPESPYKTP